MDQRAHLDGPAIRNANRRGSHESIRRKPYFHDVQVIPPNCLTPAIRDFLVPRNPIRKKGVQFWKPGMIRVNQAIGANLRIDSRESGHLRSRSLGLCDEILSFGGCALFHLVNMWA